MAARWPFLEIRLSAVTPELMDGSSPEVHLGIIYYHEYITP
jgi:hypothetical protein